MMGRVSLFEGLAEWGALDAAFLGSPLKIQLKVLGLQ